jgi:hypothetical protein
LPTETNTKRQGTKSQQVCAASQTAFESQPTFANNKARQAPCPLALMGGRSSDKIERIVMATALIEDSRITLYRKRLAALLRRPSCQWMAFAIGAAPVHRGFFDDVVAAIEGLPAGGAQPAHGSSHRQVQYGVRLRILAGERAQASYDAEGDVLYVPGEAALDSLDGQAGLVHACVHLGLDIEARNHNALDSESAARVAGQLYRLFESIADADGEGEVTEKLQALAPASPADKASFEVAAEILRHRRTTLRANLRASQPLQPGSFMKFVRTAQRSRLHELLAQEDDGRDRRPARRPGGLPRASRFLALQPLALSAA